MNLALWLDRAGRAVPDQPAIGHGRRAVRSYGELAERSARLARVLREVFGLGLGDRVALVAKNSPEYLEVLYAAWWAGLVAVPVNVKLHGAEVGFILEQSGAKACFASAEVETDVAAHAPAALERLIVIGSPAYAGLFVADPLPAAERAADDLAWLFYTSGTTGRPKGAMLTHGNLSAMAHAYLAEVDPTERGDA